jgi:GNAT superfamily N-acetyltransferase
LIYLTRPNENEAALGRRETVTVEDLTQRLTDHHLYLIYLDDQLIGEMSYQVDPPHLYKKETGTAWIGITISEEIGRGKGIGYQALEYLEEQIKAHGLKRMELGVFEFNTNAIKLYNKLGYKEIARIDNFTYWQGKIWQDIRMEKYVSL